MKIVKNPNEFIVADIAPFVSDDASPAEIVMTHRISVLPDGRVIRGGCDINEMSLLVEARALIEAYQAILKIKSELKL